ncbi:hypothetical protein GCM10009665_13210 [Kitasatospora nipponensis]|uniref:Uncharacterized protein n=1 Tax=Kitasatospora nipponensis TaxID=258049 RepID=A0ABP4GIJ1_9ACTN
MFADEPGHSGGMLWSDPRDEESREARRVRAMLRRAGPLLAAAVVLIALLLMLRL